MSAMLLNIYLAVGMNFCGGTTIDGVPYQDVIRDGQAGYTNEPSWSTEVKKGQRAICGQASF